MGEITASVAGYGIGDRIVYRYLRTPGVVVGFDRGRLLVELESESAAGKLRAALSPSLVEKATQAA